MSSARRFRTLEIAGRGTRALLGRAERRAERTRACDHRPSFRTGRSPAATRRSHRVGAGPLPCCWSRRAYRQARQAVTELLELEADPLVLLEAAWVSDDVSRTEQDRSKRVVIVDFAGIASACRASSSCSSTRTAPMVMPSSISGSPASGARLVAENREGILDDRCELHRRASTDKIPTELRDDMAALTSTASSASCRACRAASSTSAGPEDRRGGVSPQRDGQSDRALHVGRADRANGPLQSRR